MTLDIAPKNVKASTDLGSLVISEKYKSNQGQVLDAPPLRFDSPANSLFFTVQQPAKPIFE